VTGRPTLLVLRALYLGDLLTGLPALSLLRRGRPDHRIVLAAPAQVGALAVLAGVVDELTPARELEPLLAAPRGAQIAVDLHGNGPASRDLLAATRPGRLVAFAGGDHAWRPDEHEVTRWCRLVSEAFGLSGPWPGVGGSLPTLPTAGLPVACTVIHPGAKAAARRWPADRFAAVARALVAAGHRVLITGGPGEERLAREVADAGGATALTGLRLSQLLALIERAGLVICGDTGIAHVASAYRCPSVLLFGPVSPAHWGPPDDPRHRVLWHGDDSGDPQAGEPDPALLAITVDEVLAALPTREQASPVAG